MPKQIDWLYDRRACTTCQKARSFLEQATVTVHETVNATKTRFDAAAALALLTGIDTLIAAKGKKVETFDLKAARPTDTELLARLLGPTGNLRAPTARIGKTLIVGFNPELYEQLFSKQR